jgi:hypothetical protein
MDTTHSTIWDPINKDTNSQSVIREQNTLTRKILSYYEKNPRLFKYFLILLILITLFSFICSYMPQFSYLQIWMYIFYIILISYYWYLTNLQGKTFLILLCKKNNWFYNPNDDNDKLRELITTFPEIFTDEPKGQILNDQIWE